VGYFLLFRIFIPLCISIFLGQTQVNKEWCAIRGTRTTVFFAVVIAADDGH
jgi:hypothetical protein